MTTLEAVKPLQVLLSSVQKLAAVLDEEGCIIGYYMPAGTDPEFARRYVEAAARIDPDEIARRKTEIGKGMTTAEVLQYLQTLKRP